MAYEVKYFCRKPFGTPLEAREQLITSAREIDVEASELTEGSDWSAVALIREDGRVTHVEVHGRDVITEAAVASASSEEGAPDLSEVMGLVNVTLSGETDEATLSHVHRFIRVSWDALEYDQVDGFA